MEQQTPEQEQQTQKPLGLILARNLLTNLSTAAFLVDREGGIIFYNEAAGALLGVSFEEFGRKRADEWGREVGPFGERRQAARRSRSCPPPRRCARAARPTASSASSR